MQGSVNGVVGMMERRDSIPEGYLRRKLQCSVGARTDSRLRERAIRKFSGKGDREAKVRISFLLWR